MADFQPFQIDIPKEEVDRLNRKLKDTRLPGGPIVADAGTRYGPPYEWAQALYNTWINDFDWYSVQNDINKYPQYTTSIENLNIFFLHARAERPNAIPLLMVHGWPGCFWEFSRVWGPLSRPSDDEDIAFHVVVPSLPGFCWSDGPHRSGWTLQDTARVFDQLMKKLGYQEYMVQCGDWGHFVGRELASKYTDSCKLLHFNFAPSPLPPGMECTDREKATVDRENDWLEKHIGYAVCMRTRPHTIGLALHDNPLGILMWVGEKFIEASNPENQSDPSWTHAILTTASLYYFSNCIMSSMLPYYENVEHDKFAEFVVQRENRIKVPFGYTSFIWDTEPSSRRAVERTGELVFYRERDDAGHFAALEHPSGLVEDLRELAGGHWRAT